MSNISSRNVPIRDHRSSVTRPRTLKAARNGVNGGFTLIELMVTLAVGAILLAVAVPSFRTFVQNAQVNNTADSFLAAMQRARSEAITRGDKVILCRTSDPSTDSCGDSSPKDWSSGWLMYAVPTADGEVDYTGSYLGSEDNVLIKRGSPAPQGVAITSDNDGDTWLTFAPDGTLGEPSIGPGNPFVAYAICDERGEKEGKLLVIPEIGRPYSTDSETNEPPDQLSYGPGAPNCLPND